MRDVNVVAKKMTRKGRKLANSQMIPVFLTHKTIQANILIKIEFAFKETNLDTNVYINERHFLFRISKEDHCKFHFLHNFFLHQF